MKDKKITLKQAFSKKRIIAVLIVFILIAVMLISNPEVQKFLFESDTVALSFQAGTDYKPVVYDNQMLLASNSGIRAVDSRGRESFSLVKNVTEPLVMVKNDYIMLSDAGGTEVYLYKNDKFISEIKTEREILTAKLNKNGYIAVATSELGYKGVAKIFDRSGKEIFNWYSGSGYIGDIDISKDNNIAAVQLMTDKEEVYSRIMLIDASAKEEAKCIAEVNGIVMKIKYRENGGLLAVSESGVYAFKKNGKEDFVIDFEGRTPTGCNIENERNMVFAFDSGLNNTILESYSSNGKLRGSFETDGEAISFDVNGECILVATINGVTRLTPSGKEKSRMDASQDIKTIKIFSGRDEFLSLGSGSMEIIKIK